MTSGAAKVEWQPIHEQLLGCDNDLFENIDILVILDCCFAGLASRTESRRTLQILSACAADSKTRARPISVPALFQFIEDHKPKEAPHSLLKTLGGTSTIVLIPQSSQTQRLLPTLPPNMHTRTSVLVKLVLDGKPSDMARLFQSAISDLPSRLHVEVKDAYETDASVGFILGLSWESLALWGMVADLEIIMVTLGPSLIHTLAEVQAAGENLPPRGTKDPK
ncbi:uncharacterized protein N7482_007177 [Penicillium canariense]|uniref:Uncharacterized protein n=1 Tax=Penicillium canariense TaxID=189055 RepID=A0A9W9LK25_9EURO|nr:uncharacterized protein N7482_007177 [Penicillium canariense]KAJ5160173.1 hypothetical protein N7482_007177 [Penicillium canariense]